MSDDGLAFGQQQALKLDISTSLHPPLSRVTSAPWSSDAGLALPGVSLEPATRQESNPTGSRPPSSPRVSSTSVRQIWTSRGPVERGDQARRPEKRARLDYNVTAGPSTAINSGLETEVNRLLQPFHLILAMQSRC